MSADEGMNIDERYEYLRMMYKRYTRADRVERSRLLDEMEAFTAQHRKALIRTMQGEPRRKVRQQQRGRSYGPRVTCHRGKPGLHLCRTDDPRFSHNGLPKLAAHGELHLTAVAYPDKAPQSLDPAPTD